MFILLGVTLVVVTCGALRCCNRPQVKAEELENIMARMDEAISSTKED